MKLSQAGNCFLEYHKLNSKKKYGEKLCKFTIFAAQDRPDVDANADSTVTPFRLTDKKKGLRPV